MTKLAAQVALRLGLAGATSALALAAACGDLSTPEKADKQAAKDGTTTQTAGAAQGPGAGTGGASTTVGGSGSDTQKGVSTGDMIVGNSGGTKPKPTATPVISGPPDPRSGAIVDVAILGHVFGWAVDKTNLTTSIDVELYADGPKGTGALLGTAHAGTAGASGNNPGAHRYDFQIPASAADGHAHTLYLYNMAGTLLDPTPTPYTAYTGTAAGMAYFQANVVPKVSECSGCHQMTYDFAYPLMLSPAPHQGGTKLKNILMEKPLTDGVSHGGGKKCASASADPCAEFQQWWTVEFGNL